MSVPIGSTLTPIPSLARSPSTSRTAARALGLLFVLIPVALIFVPWRQTIPGSGRVIGYAPLDRQFNVEAPIYGRVEEWLVVEGTKVKKGQLLARMTNVDPMYMDALKAQETSSKGKLSTAQAEVLLYNQITERFGEVREMALSAARNYVSAAEQKVLGEEQERVAALAAKTADELQKNRQVRLLAQSLVSSRDVELAEQKFQESSAKLQKAEASLRSAKIDVQAKQAYLAEVTAKTQADIDKNNAEAQKAQGKVNEAEKELAELGVKIRTQLAQEIKAPRDGTILRLLVNQGTEQVKDGDAIAVLVPDAADLAVELKVDGNDVPLIQDGDIVRLQFEGWPAVQFAGWPSVAVGTFGGKVVLVDSHDDGKGKFRIVVLPTEDQAWPSDRYLRQGVRAKGWVLLREVRLGYEIWRRVNGFPQAISTEEPAGKAEGESSEKPKTKRPK